MNAAPVFYFSGSEIQAITHYVLTHFILMKICINSSIMLTTKRDIILLRFHFKSKFSSEKPNTTNTVT